MSELFSKIDALFKREVGKDAPGATLAILHHGALVYQNAWGLASIENPLPLTPQSVFNTGSIAKTFTAYALLYLQQQRKLSLEDELRKHIPEFPYYGIPTRLRHLLWHTSGIRCYTTLLWWGGVPQRDNYSRKQALELICRQKELNFASGSEYLYGNSNYLLLSEVVQRVSGKSIGELCKKLIFEPLGMNQTHFREDPGRAIPGLASGHLMAAGTVKVTRFLGSVPGVGSLMSSVEDLAKLERFFLQPRKHEQGLLRLMLSPGWLENGAKIRYGGGIMLQHYRGQAMQRHDGFTAGHRAEYCRFPDQGYTLVCMTNTYRISPTWMIRQCANILFPKALDPVSALGPGQPAAPPARFKMSSKALAQYEGLYRDRESGAYLELDLQPEGLHFRNKLTGFMLQPERPGAFQGQAAGAIYRVDFEEDGGLIVLKQGRASRYEKIKVQGRQSDEKLARFVGRYACPELLTRVDVLIKEGSMVLNDANGNEWPLKALKGGRFYSFFRDLHFSKKGLLMEAPDAWVRRLKWIKL